MLDPDYNPWLIAASIAIAILDSYVAFSVIGRLVRSRGWIAFGWLVLGALAMGTGVWAMHFVGMLAFHLGTPLGYRVLPTVISVLPIVAASGTVLWQAARKPMSRRRLIINGALLGSGIGAMHYIGMAAMDMQPAIEWNPWRVGASILFAVVGSIAAIAFNLRVAREKRRARRTTLRWLGATIMGCAVAGMHYLGMSAAEFANGVVCLSAGSILRGQWLGAVVSAASLGVLLFTLISALIHQRVQRRQQQTDAALDRAHSALAFQAFHDSLTGLPNRARLMETLRTLLDDPNSTFALMFIDLDGFKTINDSLGHDAGDEFLRSVAQALRASVRERDTVARFGGDEFVIVLREFRGTENLVAICENVLALVAEPVTLAGHTLSVSPSIGVALAPKDGTDPETLLRNADTAMYTVKEVGKAGYRFFERNMHQLARERLSLTQELRGALDRGEIKVHYQIQRNLSNDELAGLEALARWANPERGDIPPSVFVPIAERSGLITMIGTQVLREVLTQLKAWDAGGFHPPYVAINLSLQELRDPSFVTNAAQVVKAHGIEPARIHFEITESTAMRHPEATLLQLRLLRTHGFSLSVDDFGTGYSSLSHLRQMPTRTIKIDQSFIRGSMENHADREITEAIVALAKKLRLETIAEGVESSEQAAWLKDIGCDYGQGFYFAHPLSAIDLLRHLGLNPQPDESCA
jgi:diguanylate cyclase (GGDEF)-like protein